MPRSRRLNPKELAREAARRGGRMRSWSGGRPDIVPVLVEERLEDGRYKVRRDHWLCSIYVPVTPAGSEIPTLSRQRLLFEGGNPQRPFLLWHERAKAVLGPIGGGEPLSTWPWPRLAARTTGRYFPAVPEGTRVAGSAPNPAEERYTARIVRVWMDGSFAMANDNYVWQQGVGDIVEGEPGSSVVALWETGGVRLTMVEGPPIIVEGYGDGWNDGWADGINGQPGHEGPYDAGRRSCEDGYGYDPYFGYDEPTPPAGHNEDWIDGYRDGYLSGWTEKWNEGYESGGCEIP